MKDWGADLVRFQHPLPHREWSQGAEAAESAELKETGWAVVGAPGALGFLGYLFMGCLYIYRSICCFLHQKDTPHSLE